LSRGSKKRVKKKRILLKQKEMYEYLQEKGDLAAVQLVPIVAFHPLLSPLLLSFPPISILDYYSILHHNFSVHYTCIYPTKLHPKHHELCTVTSGTITLPLQIAAPVLDLSGRERTCSVSGEGVIPHIFHIYIVLLFLPLLIWQETINLLLPLFLLKISRRCVNKCVN
jgi:hypothetical protein